MNGWSLSRVTVAPLNRPISSTAAKLISRATGHGQCQALTAMASSTPWRAKTDPTDRSIPPVMMTRPAPIEKMPNRPM